MGNLCGHKLNKIDNQQDACNMIRILLVGDSGVGKTTIVNKIISPDQVNVNCSQTVACQTHFMAINGTIVQIIDTPGIEAYRKCIPQFIVNRSDIAIFVNDGKCSSLRCLLEWNNRLKDQMKFLLVTGPEEQTFTETLSSLHIDFLDQWNISNKEVNIVQEVIKNHWSTKASQVTQSKIYDSGYYPILVEYIN